MKTHGLFGAVLLAAYAFGLPLDAAALTLTRGPYLQLGTQSSIVVRWRTETATDSRVRYGTNPSNLSSVVDDSTSTTEHVVKLTGLNPSTKYYYSVGHSEATLAGGTGQFFVAAPPPGTEQPTNIWVLGNAGIANAKARAVRDAYLKYKGDQYTHLWLMLGHNAHQNGTDTDYQDALFNTYPTLLRQTTLWPALGHRDDGVTADSASQSGAYYDIFTLPKQGEAGGLASGTEAYYSFDYSNIHFVVLDSVEGSKAPSGAMLTWLENDLAVTTQPWIIAYWDHPPCSKGFHDSDTEIALREMRENVLPILEDASVDLVLNADCGSYERSFPIDGHSGSSATFEPQTMLVDGGDGSIDGGGEYQTSVIDRPIRDAVVGSSGETQVGSLDYPVIYISLKTLGSMALNVNGPLLDAVFLDDTGQVRDRFRMVKTSDAMASTAADATPTKNTTTGSVAAVPQQQTNTSGQGTSVAATPLSTTATGVTYYVDTNHPSASDSNPGTEALPWKTIQKAANTLVAGDTVYIKQGTYTGLVSAKNSGSPGAFITYSAYPGHELKAIIDGNGVMINQKNYINISGLRIQNVPPGVNEDAGIKVKGPSSYITLSGNHTYNTNSSGISIWGVPWTANPNVYGYKAITNLIIENNKVENCVRPGAYDECITLANGVDTFELRGNHVFNGNNGCCGGEGIDLKAGISNGKVYRNEIYNFHKIAIYLDAGPSGGPFPAGTLRNIDIFENYVRDTSGGTGISIVSEGTGHIDGIRVYNNLVTNSGGDGILLYKHPWEDPSATVKNITIINNTTYNNGLYPVHWGGGIRIAHPKATNVVGRNNIAYGNKDYQMGTEPGNIVSNNLTTDPQFVNEAAKDFHLKSTSPAINVGSSTLAPATDYDGVARPQGSAFDIGAYEFGGSVPPSDTTPPSTPTALSATAISSSQANLSWTASIDNVSVAGYRVERCQGAGCTNFAQIATPTGTTYSNTGLSANTTYVYRVRAADAAGNLSPYSAAANATTQAASSSFTVSASPSTVAPGGTITVSWSAPSNHSTTDWVSILAQGTADTAYNSWKYVPSGTSGTLTLTASTESGNPLPTGTYEVRYYLNDGFTRAATSNKVTVSSSSDITAPSTPTGLTATAVSSSQINLSWNASTDNVSVAGYRVERCQGSGCTSFAQIATPTGTTYSNTGLSANTTYVYRVRAVDAARNFSPYSAAANATPSTSGQFVMSFTLVNADTDKDIQTLNNGATLDFAALPTRNLNIRANTSPSLVGSVKFGYDSNASYRIESVAPYALAGDSSSNYYAWTPTIGSHTITVTPYTGSNATGVAGTPLRVSFTVR